MARPVNIPHDGRPAVTEAPNTASTIASNRSVDLSMRLIYSFKAKSAHMLGHRSPISGDAPRVPGAPLGHLVVLAHFVHGVHGVPPAEGRAQIAEPQDMDEHTPRD